MVWSYSVIPNPIKNRQLTLFFLTHVQKSFPILFGMIEKTVEIYIIHKWNPHYCCKAEKTLGANQ